MTANPSSPAPSEPLTTPAGALPVLDSPRSASLALRWGFMQALSEQARHIHCVAPRFDASWPLDDAELLQSLAAWLKQPGRRLVLLAASFDEVPRQLPRFAAWRAPWVHAIHALRAPAESAASLPSVLFDDRRVCVQLMDPTSGRGRASLDAREPLIWAERLDAVLQRSTPDMALNTLGL